MQPQTKRILATALFAIAWVAAVAFGGRALFQYENTPGRVGALPPEWPAAQIERAADRPTLVMLAHPHCPCTAASIGELAQIMARFQGKVAAYVLFVKSKGASPAWEETKLRRSAEAIPGIKVLFDADGAEASRFGAETSGHTLLFGADGHLLFSGGLTASRGHAGENPGESAILALLNHQTPAQSRTLVFGCPLLNSARPEATALCSN